MDGPVLVLEGRGDRHAGGHAEGVGVDQVREGLLDLGREHRLGVGGRVLQLLLRVEDGRRDLLHDDGDLAELRAGDRGVRGLVDEGGGRAADEARVDLLPRRGPLDCDAELVDRRRHGDRVDERGRVLGLDQEAAGAVRGAGDRDEVRHEGSPWRSVLRAGVSGPGLV
jgi:hypothetical protein